MSFVETFLNRDVFVSAWPLLVSGLKVTLLLGITSILAGLVLGLFVALARLYAVRPVQVPVSLKTTESPRL